MAKTVKKEVPSKFNNLENKSIEELTCYAKALNVVIAHYDNLANVSTGIYADAEFYQEQYLEARKKIEYYSEIKNYVFSAIEDKLNTDLLNNA